MHPLVQGWRERFATYAVNNTVWNYPNWADDDVENAWGLNVVSPQYGGSPFHTNQGVAPANLITKNLLPDWWATIEDEPARLVV